MAGGRCSAGYFDEGKKICGNPTVLFCDECGTYFCDKHIGQWEGDKGIDSRNLCINCKRQGHI